MILLNVSIWKSIYQWNSLQVLKNPNQRHVAYCIDNILISQQPVWSNTSDNVFQFCFSDILKLSWKTSFFFFFLLLLNTEETNALIEYPFCHRESKILSIKSETLVKSKHKMRHWLLVNLSSLKRSLKGLQNGNEN